MATSAAFILYSMPSFVLGLILIQVFALSFPIFNFEASQSTSIWVVIGDWHSMFLPVLTLTLLTVANFSRYMRSSSIDVLAQDYIKVARAKGLPERLVLPRHMVRNASLPMITLIGLFLPALLAGNLIIETCSTTRAWACSSTTAWARRTIRCCWPIRSSAPCSWSWAISSRISR